MLIAKDSAFLSAAQARAHLLCSECEGRFNREGEDWVIENCWHGPANFQLHSALMLRRESEYVNPDEPEEERKRRTLARYTEASRALYQFYEPRQPFFAESMLESLRGLDPDGVA